MSIVSIVTDCSNDFASSMSYNHINKTYHKLQTVFDFHEIITCKLKMEKSRVVPKEYISTKMKTLLKIEQMIECHEEQF